MQVVCEHPVIIINPKLAELVNKYRHYFWRGKEFILKYRPRHIEDFDYRPFNVKRNSISHKDLGDCYVVDDSTGEIFPIYLEVPCGKCDICKVSKINSLVERVRYESQMYDCLPWFVTLTYDNEHVRYPEFKEEEIVIPGTDLIQVQRIPVGGVNVRDCQLFLKRLRRNIERSSNFNFSLRYLLVAEYGKKPITGSFPRPHYHMILFGVNTFTTQDHLKFVELLRASWQCGNIRHRLMDLSKDDKGTYYTSKYLKKGCVVPDGCAPTFMLSSKGHGGIGSGFIDKHKKKIRETLNIHYKFLDKWTKKVKEIQWSRYLLNRVFPSFYRSVSSEFRKSVQGIVTYGKKIYNFDLSKFLDYDKYFYTGFHDNLPRSLVCESRYSVVSTKINDLLQSYVKSFVSLSSCEEAKKISELRQKFLGRLFRYQFDTDLKVRSYECNKILNYQSIYSVL